MKKNNCRGRGGEAQKRGGLIKLVPPKKGSLMKEEGLFERGKLNRGFTVNK